MSKFQLNDWQKIIVNNINSYEDFVGEQDMVAINSYEQNRMSKIQVCLRRASGHTALTGYIAKTYPSLVIYWDLNHYKEIEHVTDFEDDVDNWDNGTEFLSIYELRHDIILSNKSDVIKEGLEKVKLKFKDKKVIVLDRASQVLGRWPEIVEFIYSVSEGSAIVLLG